MRASEYVGAFAQFALRGLVHVWCFSSETRATPVHCWRVTHLLDYCIWVYLHCCITAYTGLKWTYQHFSRESRTSIILCRIRGMSSLHLEFSISIKKESSGPVIAVFIFVLYCIVSFNHIIVILLCSKFNWQLYEDRFSLSGNQSLLLQGNPWFLYFQILRVVLPIECLLGDVFWEHAGEIIYPGLPWRNLCIQPKKKGDGRQREGSLG